MSEANGDPGPAGQGPLRDPAEQSRLQDIVLVAVIALGLIVPLFLFIKKIEAPGIYSAYLLSLAGAAMLYRFLGGILPDDSFRLGVVKVGGSAAVLFGLAWWINPILEKQILEHRDSRLESELEECNAGRDQCIADRDQDFQALIKLDVGAVRPIGDYEIRLVDIKNLNRSKLSKTFLSLMEEIEDPTYGGKDLPPEKERAILSDFCAQIGSALRLSDSQKEVLGELSSLFKSDTPDWRSVINERWWKEIVAPLLRDRCWDECSQNPDATKVREEAETARKTWGKNYKKLEDALDEYPFAIYSLKKKTGSTISFGTAVAGSGPLDIGDRKYDIPVIANPAREESEKLANRDRGFIEEAIVLMPVS